MLVQFGNNWIQKIPLTAKLDSAYGLVQFWLSSEFFSSNYFQIGQHVVLLHILIGNLPSPWNEARAVVSNPADFTVSRKHSSGGTQSIGHNCHM